MLSSPWRSWLRPPDCALPLGVLVLLGACKAPPPTDPPAASITTPSATPPALPPTTMKPSPSASDPGVLRGKLRFRELPPVKSVEAYDGVEFTLLTPSGESLPLAPGAAVPRERLQALDGQNVSLRVRPVQPPPPSPFEQAPIGPNGKPLPRPLRHEVLEILER